MVRQGSAKPSSTSSNLVVTSKRFPEASASGIFCFYRALFLRSTLQRTFAVLQRALPGGSSGSMAATPAPSRCAQYGVSSNAWPVLSTTAVDYVLLKNAPLPCLRLSGQPDAARKGHCCVYRLLLQPPNQIKTKRSAPCTIQDSDRLDC